MKSTDHKIKKKAYLDLIAHVEALINKWDPYNLLSSGAPQDELREEVARIAAQAIHVETPKELAHVISRIFTDSFESELFSVEACTQVASQLFTELQTHDFLKRQP